MSAARRRDVFAWCLYDFGAHAFYTLIVTFVFSRFFVEVIASDYRAGTSLWALGINISAVVVALISPILGAVADYSGRKKLFLVLFSSLAIVFTFLMYFADKGQATKALILFVIANIGVEASNVFYYAFLPEVSRKENIGRISGLGFFSGYAGGLVSLAIGLLLLKVLPSAHHVNVRATTLFTSVWFLIFAIPMFLLVKQGGVPQRIEGGYIKHGFDRLKETISHARRYREAGKLLIARMIYNDGLTTVIAMASIYLGAELNMKLEGVLMMGVALNVFAGIGALSFGFVDDRIGGKKTILISLVLLICATAWGVATSTVGGFWIAAIFIGLMMGPNQSASRSLLSKLSPPDKQAEFFGLYSFSGRLSSIFGPLTYGMIVARTGNHKLAMSSILIFFVVGGLILLSVREEEGIKIARGEA